MTDGVLAGLRLRDWLEGARLRTLPAAVSPVILGTFAAAALRTWSPGRALLALGVALALQVGVNFANDYSDGIRGTDDKRTGPLRLTASGLVSPRTVLTAAFSFFALGSVLGLLLLYLSGAWWLLLAGAAAVAAAWFYTGGKHPYGYLGLGEVFVMAFFGYLATVGTTWTQAEAAPWWLWLVATGIGLHSCALLMVNNLRDIPTDSLVGKRTLAVRLGDGRARASYVLLVGLGWVLGAAALLRPTATAIITATLIALMGVGLITPIISQDVRAGATRRDLLATLRNTGLMTLAFAFVIGIGLVWVAG